MSIWKRLFGGGAAEAEQSAPGATLEFDGFTIRAEPYKSEGGQYQTAGTVSKEVDGIVKEHRFIRADRFGSREEASDFALAKGRQLVSEQGDRMFR